MGTAIRWKATHELTFTPARGGAPRRWTVMVVPDPDRAGWELVSTSEDWAGGTATWTHEIAKRRWLWLGMLPGPEGAIGTVTIRRLDGQVDTTPRGLRVIF